MRLSLILVIFLIISCKTKTQEALTVEIIKNDSIIRKNYILAALKNIANSEHVEAEQIGYGLKRSDVFKSFINLKELATPLELFQLVNNNNVNIKVYAYVALVEKDSILAKQAFKIHRNDRQEFTLYSGCIISKETVDEYFAQVISGN